MAAEAWRSQRRNVSQRLIQSRFFRPQRHRHLPQAAYLGFQLDNPLIGSRKRSPEARRLVIV